MCVSELTVPKKQYPIQSSTKHTYTRCMQHKEKGNLRIFLDTFANVGIIQDIDTAKIDAFLLQDLDDGGGKAAHGHGGVALHVKHDRVAFDVIFDHFNSFIVSGHFLFLGRKIIVRIRREEQCRSWLMLSQEGCGGSGGLGGGGSDESGSSSSQDRGGS